MRPRLAALALLAAACGVEEADFPDAYGKTVCSRLRQCQRADYEERYANRAECVDDWAEFADTMLDLGDTFGGEYAPEGAADCLAAIREATCEEFTNLEYTCDLFVDE